jgi:peptidoglycan/LPS O-acetylase OafA/YrhL
VPLKRLARKTDHPGRPLDRVSSNRFHIPSLDGIRGLAALLVFISHAGFQDLIPGGFGVTIFFFLSGYLITTLLRQEFQETRDISLKAFYLRRAYRILPPMYIVLIFLMLPFINGSDRPIPMSAILAQFLHFSNYYEIFAGPMNMIPTTGPMWSLAVEEHFYLLFPLTLLMLFHRTTPAKAARVLMVGCVVVLLWRCYLIFGLHATMDYTYFATDTRLDSLLYGCVMALCLNPMLDRWTLEIPRTTWIPVLGLSVVLLLFTFLYRAEWSRETLRYSLQGVALTPIFFCAIRYSTWPIFGWLNSRPMRAMGLISYTFYLIHVKAIGFTERYLDPGLWSTRFAALALAIAFSSLMYFLVEKHFAQLRRKLHSEQAQARSANTSAPAIGA